VKARKQGRCLDVPASSSVMRKLRIGGLTRTPRVASVCWLDHCSCHPMWLWCRECRLTADGDDLTWS